MGKQKQSWHFLSAIICTNTHDTSHRSLMRLSSFSRCKQHKKLTILVDFKAETKNGIGRQG